MDFFEGEEENVVAGGEEEGQAWIESAAESKK